MPKFEDEKKEVLTNFWDNAVETTIQAILALPELQDEPTPTSIFDYEDDDQRKYWQNKLRASIRKAVEGLMQ